MEPPAADDQPIPKKLLEIKHLMRENNASTNNFPKRRKRKNITRGNCDLKFSHIQDHQEIVRNVNF